VFGAAEWVNFNVSLYDDISHFQNLMLAPTIAVAPGMG
jgi:hypothetical protein